MIIFWLLAAVMVLVALAIMVPAMLGPAGSAGVQRDRLNIELYKDQLDELAADHAAGTLDDGQFEAAQRELQRELLSEIDDDAGVAPQRVGGRAVAWLVALLIPAVAAGLYLGLGQHELLTAEGQAKLVRIADGADGAHDLSNLDALVKQLAERLKQSPDELDGWRMLSRTLLQMQRFGDAAQAFRQVSRLSGDDPDTLADLAEALAMSRDGQMVGEPLELVGKALARQPEHPKGLWLSGIGQLQAGNAAQAIEHWNRLLALLPAGDPNRAQVERFIAQAGGTPSDASAAGGGDIAAAENAAIAVTVRVAAALAPQVGDGDTLFVFARAAQGPRMPLAIVRQAAAGWPATVTLDDSQAMTPNLRLSSVSEVTVGARISKSGNATPQPGDLEGRVERVLVGTDRAVEVTIGNVVGEGAASQPAADPAAERPVGGTPAGVEVEVALDPALRDRIAAGDTLFVFARAAVGPRMPLAIVRRQAGELPLTVTLDDSQAMAPNFRLSAFQEFVVGARVSKSGDALPQPGDLQGSVSGVRAGGKVRVTISETL